MSVRIHIPANLRNFTDGQSSVQVEGDSVAESLRELSNRYPSLRDKLLAPGGELHSFVNLFVGDRSIRDLDGLATTLAHGDTLLIVPALAGG